MIAVVAASGAMVMALPVSAALAADGAGADGTTVGSPGLASGNTIQIPVDVPVNVCGNTVDVVGLLNPAAGNTCANKGAAKAGGVKDDDSSAQSGGSAAGGSTEATGGSATSGGASAEALTSDSPGLIAGNGIQLPVDLPVNVSGNSVNVAGLGNPVFGNESVNGPGTETLQPPSTPAANTPAPKPPVTDTPAPKPQAPESPTISRSQPSPHLGTPTLAHTGADLTATAVAGSAALLVTGATLYRRYRPGRNH
ncbi:chaplin [Streptomyces chromofuscus]|uniref:chaplin n=1 Tax=Streptomyces chromofuscus TaxID=42881 RepID=UPI001D13E234|nr:chaplin [Streptomyces chromofuscus]